MLEALTIDHYCHLGFSQHVICMLKLLLPGHQGLHMNFMKQEVAATLCMSTTHVNPGCFYLGTSTATRILLVQRDRQGRVSRPGISAQLGYVFVDVHFCNIASS